MAVLINSDSINSHFLSSLLEAMELNFKLSKKISYQRSDPALTILGYPFEVHIGAIMDGQAIKIQSRFLPQDYANIADVLDLCSSIMEDLIFVRVYLNSSQIIDVDYFIPVLAENSHDNIAQAIWIFLDIVKTESTKPLRGSF